jgi:hypothetical protein
MHNRNFMILYVNGDSHSSAAEAVNRHAFAHDDSKYWQSEFFNKPHPDNLAVSYGKKLADAIGAELHCGALAAASNYRIIRTTKEYLQDNKPDLIVIGWSTWEREEWLHNDIYWQVNAGGVGHDWPDVIKERYVSYISNLEPIEAEHQAH